MVIEMLTEDPSLSKLKLSISISRKLLQCDREGQISYLSLLSLQYNIHVNSLKTNSRN